MKIRAITFDVGGTLIEPWPSVGHVYAEVAARYGVNESDPETLTGNFIRAWKAQTSFDYAQASWFDLVRETFGAQAAQLPPEFFPAVFDRFADADVWQVYADVLPTLETLASRSVRVGVISNWDNRLRPLLDTLKLTPYFASVVVSCEVGATKPDARLFAQAARELGVAPGELLHVGDSLSLDVRAAEAAGAIGRQVMRHRGATQSWELDSLAELLSPGIEISGH